MSPSFVYINGYDDDDLVPSRLTTGNSTEIGIHL
jgi:hypothetical protein